MLGQCRRHWVNTSFVVPVSLCTPYLSNIGFFSLNPLSAWTDLRLRVCCLDSNSTNVSHFYALEVVDRGSETQIEVGENIGFIV